MDDRSLAEWLGESDPDGGEAEPGASAPPPDEEWGPRPRRGRRLWILAVVPWALIAVGVLVLGGRGAAPTGDPEPGAAAEAPADPAVGGADEPDERDGPDVGPTAPATEPGAAADDPTTAEVVPPAPDGDGPWAAAVPSVRSGDGSPAGALALAAVHLAVTRTGEAGDERYVEVAAVEQVRPLDADRRLVTVLAVVLDGADGAWTGRRLARFAVPVGDGAEPAVLGAPWPLPAAAGWPPDDVPGEEVDDPAAHVAVAQALTAGGYADATVTAVAQVGDGLIRAAVTAIPPGEDIHRDLEPWLAAGPEPVLLGADPRSERSSDEP